MHSRILPLIIVLLSSLLAAETQSAEVRKPSEFDVKAAYIYNFAKFIEWPGRGDQGEGAALTLCVVGTDPFGPALAAIEGKDVGKRKIRIKRQVPPVKAQECDIIFISQSEEEKLAPLLDACNGRNILTIGDTKGYAQQGVMINFYLENKTVRFEINPQEAEEAGLRISANLLKIARIVGTP